ncbi:MAG: YceI family protein [Acidimicrobiia bacterium]
MSQSNLPVPGVYNVDPSHSTIGFSARHLMVSKVRGRFTDFTGVITIAEQPLDSSVEAVAQVASITTNDDQRDGHLKSGDFLDVERFPTITFRSTALRQDGSDYVLVADVTIKDVTKSIEFELEYEGTEKDPWGGTRVGFSAEAEVNRKDFGMEWNVVLETGGLLVGEKIKINLDIEAVQA